MNEEWRKIEGFMYQVSNFGRVKSIRGDLVLKPLTHYKRHKFVHLYNDEGRKKIFIHRLVAIAFIPNPGNKEVVNHIDEDKSNNHVSNLEWLTGPENTKSYFKNKRERK